MKILSIRLNGQSHLALHEQENVYALSTNGEALTSAVLLRDKEEVAAMIAAAQRTPISEGDFQYAPLLPSQKIIGVGLNYRKHAAETGMAEPESPIYFAKFGNALAGHKEDLALSEIPALDYEGELGVVIGRETTKVSVHDALEYVLGYTICNDLSARHWQGRGPQWTLGKIFDHSLPVGPSLVTTDEINDPQSLTITTRRNGEIVQNESTDDMIFSVAEIVSDLSHHVTLMPGDIISTGTPSGVIMGLDKSERTWLKANDIIAIEISGIGTLENTIV